MIDPSDDVLYRKITPVSDEALPIKGNPQMHFFFCGHKSDLEEFVEDELYHE